MVCNSWNQKADWRALCVVENEQPKSLSMITTIYERGTLAELYTFNTTSAEPPDPNDFVPPSDCHDVPHKKYDELMHPFWFAL